MLRSKTLKTNASQDALSNPYFFSSKYVPKPGFFQVKPIPEPAENLPGREAGAVADQSLQTDGHTGPEQNGIERKCAKCRRDVVDETSGPNLPQYFFKPAISPIPKMSGQEKPIQKSAEDDPVPKSSPKPPTFKVKSNKPSKTDIKETLRDEGSSFSFGWLPDPGIFFWQEEVTVHGGEEIQQGSWMLGMLQLMKDYRLNVVWGSPPQQKKCGDSFPEANLRDVKISMSGSPWFDDLKNASPFLQDGESRKTEIVDSPGVLNIPYRHPDPDFPANFGTFDFGCSFISYLSVFNYNDPLSTEAWKHLKSVSWRTSLTGSFDARGEAAEKLGVREGGTAIEGDSNGYPAGFPPKLAGLAAIDKICPLSQCWNPKLKCAKVLVP